MLNHLQQMAQRQPLAVAIEEPSGALSYAALWQAVQQAASLLDLLNVRVAAIDLPNGSAWAIAHFACLQLGIPQVPLPPFFTTEQRAHALRDAGVDALIGVTTSDQYFDLQHLACAPATLPPGTALITYTSGSTGTPKGVCLSQHGMEQVACSLLEVLGKELAQRHLSVLPLGVLLEQVGGFYTALLAGGTYIVRSEPLPDALQLSRATSCILVPELLKILLHVDRSYPDLRFAAVGGARVDTALLDEAARQCLPVYQGYGLSESASVVAVNTPVQNKIGTVGNLLPHIQCRVAEDGEIILRNPAILGYTGGAPWQGEFETGDLGAFDGDGFLTIQGRKKNLLITAYGRNIAPEWPESLLSAQPEIAQAFVYGDGQASLSALLVPGHEGADTHAALQRVNAQLPDYARIDAWQHSHPFTPANGMATGNGRLRRNVILSTLSKELNDGFLRPACA